MKKSKFVFFSLVVLVLACSNENTNEPKINAQSEIQLPTIEKNNADITSTDSNDIKKNEYIKVFNKFRDAVKKRKIEEVSELFEFPYRDESIWDFVYFRTGNYDYTVDKDFAKQDFVNYFDKIFSSDFISCILMVDESILFEKGKVTTSWIVIEETESIKVSCSMRTMYNKIENRLELTLDYKIVEDGVGYESMFGYYFKFENSRLKLNKTLFVG